MLNDIWVSIGTFVCDHYEVGMIISMVILVAAILAQYIVNTSLEEDLIELTERVEELEIVVGIAENEGKEKEEK